MIAPSSPIRLLTSSNVCYMQWSWSRWEADYATLLGHGIKQQIISWLWYITFLDKGEAPVACLRRQRLWGITSIGHVTELRWQLLPYCFLKIRLGLSHIVLSDSISFCTLKEKIRQIAESHSQIVWQINFSQQWYRCSVILKFLERVCSNGTGFFF